MYSQPPSIPNINQPSGEEVFNEDVKAAIANVRKEVKKFRKSPKLNEELQVNVKAAFQNELKLTLDVKTRLISLFDMLTRYIKLRSCIVKTMIDIGCVSIVSDDDFQMCKHLVEALEPVKLATLGICQNDANLISADAALVFLLNELQNMANNKFAQNLHTAVIERVRERRNEEIIWLMKYLLNPENIQKEDQISGKKNPSKIKHLK